MKRVNHAIVAIFIFLCSLSCRASDKLDVYVGSTPPLLFADDAGAKGTTAELIERLFKEADIEYELTVTNWAQAKRQFEQSSNGLLCLVSRHEDSEQQHDWLIEVAQVELHLGRLKHRTDIVLDSVDQLKHYKSVVVRSAVTHQILLQHGLVEGEHFGTVSTSTEVFHALKSNTVDLAFHASLITPFILNSAGFSTDYVVPITSLPPTKISLWLVAAPSIKEEYKQKIIQAHQQLMYLDNYKELLAGLN